MKRTRTRRTIPKEALANESPSPSTTLFHDGRVTLHNPVPFDAAGNVARQVLETVPSIPFPLAVLLSREPHPQRLAGGELAGATVPRACMVLQKDPEWFTREMPGAWDFAVILDPRTCGRAADYPIWFALSLLVKLEFAWIGHRDFPFYIATALVFDTLWNRRPERIPELLNLPDEKRATREALRQARALFGAKRLEDELAAIARESRTRFGPIADLAGDAERMQALDPDPPEPDLYREVRSFVAPFKNHVWWTWEGERPAMKALCPREDLERVIGPRDPDPWLRAPQGPVSFPPPAGTGLFPRRRRPRS